MLRESLPSPAAAARFTPKAIMEKSPPLHLGWLLDVPATDPPGIPVNLKASGLKAHTAIIAQSGSGKSFMLGRVLEEIAAKTYARVVIFDPNSDFIKFSEIETGAWTSPHLQPWFGAEDTLENFRQRWVAVGFDILTNREPSSLGLTHPKAEIDRISLSWGSLTLKEQANYLGFSMDTSPSEIYVLHHASRFAERDWKKTHTDDSYHTLNRFVECAAAYWAKSILKDELNSLAAKVPDGWPIDDIDFYEGEISPLAALNLYGRASELLSYRIWDQVNQQKSLSAQLRKLLAGESGKRVLCLDLASLGETEERLSVASAALNTLWDAARQSWVQAISRPVSDDARPPIFIVIDEAHNLAPAGPATVLAKTVNDILVRIATEGRKYGLFLILVTQRPTRLEPGLLSQCDNLALLKMNNRLDLDLVESGFGFVPAGWAKRALDFKIGNVLLSGNLIERALYAHVAPRRTAEGGRNLQDKAWLRDPCKETEADGVKSTTAE